MPINDKTFSHRPVSELFAIVKGDFKKFDEEGLIDEDNLIKTVMYCNEKLGLAVREVREVAVPVHNYKAELPKDFEKLYYTFALGPTGTSITSTTVTSYVDPFNNNFDSDVIWEANLDRESLGCVDNYNVTIQKAMKAEVYNHGSWVEVDVAPSSYEYCHIDCPNKKKKGRYTLTLHKDHIETPFKEGTLYLMYIGAMTDENGEITFPFNPMITPYYEWMIKEKILSDALFNSDATNITELYKLAQSERVKAWIDAYNFTFDAGWGEYTKLQKKKELGWYHKHFKYFQ